MDCNPVQTVPTAQGAFAWHTTRAWVAGFVCGLLIIVPAVNDVFRPHDNFSILYLVPMLICAWLGQPRLLRCVTAICVTLTYVGWSVRFYFHASPFWKWGVLNRSFVVVALIIGGYLLEVMLRNLRQRALWRPARMDEEHAMIEEIIYSSQRFGAVFCAIAMSGAIFLLDLFTPGQINCPILYAVPLLIIVWARSHVWIWTIVGLTVVLSIVGWFVGNPPTIAENLFEVLEVNRCIAITMLIGFGVIIHLATLNPYLKVEVKKIGIADFSV